LQSGGILRIYPPFLANIHTPRMLASLWLFSASFDARMGSASIKVLLFLRKCPAHPTNTTVLKNIK
jgi:hypothetical protein